MSLKEAVGALRSLKAELEASRRSKVELEVAHRGLIEVMYTAVPRRSQSSISTVLVVSSVGANYNGDNVTLQRAVYHA